MSTAILVLLLVGAVVAIFLLWRRNRVLVEEFAPITNARAEVRRARDEAQRLRASAQADAARLRTSAKAEADKLRSEAMAEVARAGEEAQRLAVAAQADAERLKANAKVEMDAARSQTMADFARTREEAHSLLGAAKHDAEGLRASTAAEMDALRTQTMGDIANLKQQRAVLSQEYTSARALYEKLRHEIGRLEENIEDVSVGLYKPHYKYDSSEEYKKALAAIRDRQKALARSGYAAVCGKTWQIGGDAQAGERMTKQYLKLILRAFNGECDAAIAKVSWNNILKMEERIRETYDTINDLGRVMEMRITADYLELKLAELRLEYETARKKHEEQEEQRRIRERMREEERALREAEKARQEAEEEEARNQKALQKARAELAEAKGESLELLKTRIEQLDAALHKAQELKAKATSMAQLTRSGHVYVISNVGSFGENVFKIGMTRRLDPMDRIWELGDASVPFDFDVHAMLYSVDAPTLESALQTSFQDRAINLVNPRKEFFAVTLEEVEAVARERGVQIEFTKLAEAREFRETVALRKHASEGEKLLPPTVEFPAAI